MGLRLWAPGAEEAAARLRAARGAVAALRRDDAAAMVDALRPVGDRRVCFFSDRIVHEVLPTEAGARVAWRQAGAARGCGLCACIRWWRACQGSGDPGELVSHSDPLEEFHAAVQ